MCNKNLTTTNCVKYFRINTKPNLDSSFSFSKNCILSRIDQDRYCFSHMYELRITFRSFFKDMTYDHYLKHPMPMCAIRLNQILARSPNLQNFFR